MDKKCAKNCKCSKSLIKGKRTLIFTYELNNTKLKVYHNTGKSEHGYANCVKDMFGAEINFYTNEIHLDSIVHELFHAVMWFQALGEVGVEEDGAQFIGYWFESILTVLLDKGWKYGNKSKDKHNVWNIEKQVVLIK